MIITLVSLLPIVTFLIILKFLDSFALVKRSALWSTTGYGALVCILLLAITKFVEFPQVGGQSTMPFWEEVLKAIPVIIGISRRRIKFLAEALIYGASIGGGFALVENTVYLMFNYSAMTVGTAIFRGFSCATLHVGCTALIATIAVLTADFKPKALFKILAFIPSIILHFIMNLLVSNGIVSPAVQLVVTVAGFWILIALLFSAGQKKIYKWMDHSISIDVETLSSIKKGCFASTKAGMYLMDVKEQFKPEVFFDMINFVELYLEIKIEKQSRMLLSQAGFADAIPQAETDAYNAKVLEFESLKKFIGKTGLQVLSPLVKDS
ncbi:MAG: PrsW family intramembrane metalloprotease [Bacteroidales bacterium]|nr:PrsW family intramembrane metalloprotease [Bacteroidales bacterium]